MKLRSPTDQPLHVALTTGHTTVITPDGSEVDQKFFREAIARGAVPVDSSASQDTQSQVLDRQLAIQEAISAMIEGKVSDDFTADGKPNLARLKAKAGFQVTREEADAIFDQLTQPAN